MLQDEFWQESRGFAEWVIVTDIDEHLYHPHIEDYLVKSKENGVTIIPALGYQMLSEEFPPQDCLLSTTLTRGAPFFLMNKLNIFSPDEIEATNFTLGRHAAAPRGNVVPPARDELLLLHYKYLGFERTFRRHALYYTRQRTKDLAKGWGVHYSWSREKLQKEWNDYSAALVDISQPDLRPWETHRACRWWRRRTIGARLWNKLKRAFPK